jgi:hypothetical protein
LLNVEPKTGIVSNVRERTQWCLQDAGDTLADEDARVGDLQVHGTDVG